MDLCLCDGSGLVEFVPDDTKRAASSYACPDPACDPYAPRPKRYTIQDARNLRRFYSAPRTPKSIGPPA